MLPDDDDPIVFVGGKDYLPLFCRVTAPQGAQKVVFFNSRIGCAVTWFGRAPEGK